MPEPEADHARRVVRSYQKPESRLSYRLLLGGTKHYGYYPAGSRGLSMARAVRVMEDELGVTLDLPPGARVLDAGCGRVDVAVRLATRFGLQVDQAGFETIAVEDISRRVEPMVRRLAWICFVPAQLAQGPGGQGVLLNCTAAVESYRHRQGWRYNVVTARRPP